MFPNVPPVSITSRYSMAVFAVGDRAEAPSFYSSLTDINCPADVNNKVPTTSDIVHQRDAQISEQSPMAMEPDTEQAEETDDKETQWATFLILLDNGHRQCGNTSSGLKIMLIRLRRVTTVGQ